MEERARREEALFTRAPLTRMDKRRLKHVCGSTNGFEDDIKSLPLEDGVDGQKSSFMYLEGRGRKFKRQKVNKLVISPSYYRSQEAPFRVHFV
ncbi:hypothetical protein Hanom_Chr04g00329941 [Helianthus anomalus]